jgi:3-hydroxyisobutyrate dehydrogenase-like beta-hydroxyacid dehydrogenase
MKETVGFIGLGGMGLAMATNLLKAGFGLRVYNRTAERARPLLEQGARLARSPAEAAEPGGMVVTMVSDDRAVEEVTLGPEGLLDRLGDGVHLSMSTIAARTWRKLRCLAGFRQASSRGRGETMDRDLGRCGGTSKGATAPGGDESTSL